MRTEAKLFQLEALQASERGQTETAINAISMTARTGHCLDEDPLLIGQLVRLAIYTMTIESAERLLSHHRLNDSELKQLHQILSGLEAGPGLKKSLIGERAVGFDVFGASSASIKAVIAMAAGDDPEESPKSLTATIGFFRLVGLNTADKRLMGETYEKIFHCIENPNFATNDLYHKIFEDVVMKSRAMPPKVLTAMLVPVLEKVAGKFVRVEAIRRCSETAICIERYRLKHEGMLPADLSDVPTEYLPAIPSDPFNGQPLRYKKLSTGFVVYSVGPNREDDDGYIAPLKNNSVPNGSDIGFRVERIGSR